MPSNSRRGFSSPTFILGAYLVLYFLCFVLGTWGPIRGYADYNSDAATVIAGRNFSENGFLQLHFLSVPFPIVMPAEELPYDYYTHYPPGGTLLYGVLDSMGLDHVGHARVSTALFSCLGLWFFHGLVVSVTHKPKPALVATMLLSLSPFFFPYTGFVFPNRLPERLCVRDTAVLCSAGEGGLGMAKEEGVLLVHQRMDSDVRSILGFF